VVEWKSRAEKAAVVSAVAAVVIAVCTVITLARATSGVSTDPPTALLPSEPAAGTTNSGIAYSPAADVPSSSFCATPAGLLDGNRILQRLYAPAGSLAGYQLTFSHDVEIPAGWVVEIDLVQNPGPYLIKQGQKATVWAPESCRPLPPS